MSSRVFEAAVGRESGEEIRTKSHTAVAETEAEGDGEAGKHYAMCARVWLSWAAERS